MLIPPPEDQPSVPISNVNWKVNASTLLSGSAGADVNFDVLDGKGEGLVKRNLAGDVSVTDGKLQIPAQQLEQFLPLPIAQFGGVILANLEELELENNLLKRTQGTLIWSSAEVINTVKLGQVVLDIVPDGELHVATLSNTDGQLDLSGTVQLDQAGGFQSDILVKPTAQTPSQVTGMLNLVGRPASDGSYRLRNNGNINDYM